MPTSRGRSVRMKRQVSSVTGLHHLATSALPSTPWVAMTLSSKQGLAQQRSMAVTVRISSLVGPTTTLSLAATASMKLTAVQVTTRSTAKQMQT